MKSVLVLGFYNMRNLGDEAYKDLLPRFCPDCKFTFVNNLPKDIKQYDKIILGGGNVIAKDFLSQLVDKPNKSIISASAFNTIDKSLLQGFDYIAVRDIKSCEILTSMGVKCEYMPDLAFLLESDKDQGKQMLDTMFQEGEKYKKVVTIVVNAYLGHSPGDHRLARDEYHFQEFCNQMAGLIDNYPASFVFIPFSTALPYDDRVSNGWLAKKCKYHRKNLVIYDKLSIQETLNILSASDAVIATRLHASIFSCIANVPFIDLSHHDKTAGFLKTIGWQDWSTSYWNFDSQRCKELLTKAIDNKMELTNKLRTITVEQKKLLEEAKKHVCIC